MFECKICNVVLTRGSGHIKAKHGISTLEYIEAYEGIDVSLMYKDGYSAQQICSFIKEKNIGVNPIKKDILSFLKNKNIAVRSTSEAISCWSEKNGGPWNKNLTKEEHPSIMRYSVSRTGKKNIYWRLSDDKKRNINWTLWKSESDKAAIRRKAGDSLKAKYANGELVSHSKKFPEWEENSFHKRMEGYKKWQQSGNKIKFGNTSRAESEIAEILENLDIPYIRQFSPGKYRYDFYLPRYNLIIEYNGTYWHADPRIYEVSYYNSKKQKTAGEIWKYDDDKNTFAKQAGYDIAIIWEDDFKRKTTKEKGETINEIIENQANLISSQRQSL